MPQQLHLAISAQFHPLLVRTCRREQNKHITSYQYMYINKQHVHSYTSITHITNVLQ